MVSQTRHDPCDDLRCRLVGLANVGGRTERSERISKREGVLESIQKVGWERKIKYCGGVSARGCDISLFGRRLK